MTILDGFVKVGFFTSDLSVNEFLLVKQAGFDPLGLVIGSSIYHIGYQQSSWKQSMEMEVLCQAMYEARELAMTRMEEEADQLGADGIVGVRLDIGRYEWGQHLAEFIAIGTAVKHHDGEMHRAPNGRPFTSDLSGQDFTQALYDARELAMERMQKEGEELQAEGIVGVQLQERSHGWGSHVIEFFAVGTAIVPSEAARSLPEPITTISLND